jgi:hypothetical protein
MKKLFLSLVLTITTLISYSQVIDYPIIHKDSFGVPVVTMTMNQAKKLVNRSDLLDILEKTNSKMSDLDSFCIRIINDKEFVIIEQQIQISNLKLLIDNKDEQIENLQKRINDYELKSELYNREVINKDKEIELHLGEISRLKGKILFGTVSSSIIVVILTTILITR